MRARRIAGIVVHVLLATGLAFTQGCKTVATSVAPGQTVENVNPPAAESFVRVLNVGVTSRAGDDASKAVAGTVQSAIESLLAKQAFRIDNAAPNIRIELTFKTVLFDRSGEYYRYNGDIESVVTRVDNGRVFGKQTFHADGLRALGSEPAMRGLANKFVPEVNRWITETFSAVSTDLAAEDVVVRRCLPALASGDPAYALDFVRIVGKEPGVVSCYLIAQDYTTRTMTFRVVYDRGAFAGGFFNRILTIDKLGLKVVRQVKRKGQS